MHAHPSLMPPLRTPSSRRPKWVSKVTVPVAQANINRAAHLLRKAFAVDPRTVELVGGEQWWTLRGTALTGEWIEVRSLPSLAALHECSLAHVARPLLLQMKKDKVKRGKIPAERVLLYLHGASRPSHLRPSCSR